ncbi:E3 ubiquitin-protein ligase TRIM39-like [Hyperolius riggenbachi]|uniref:E3 ubiquitin-protein ligase TRIM39-like n=1 Tax=Hyperolius riggenbachi TaxID=752182 RepID=UPI0035A30154
MSCETSLCDHHLRKHGRSVKHTLLPPTTDLGKRKCSVHKEILEYYCTEDAVCICVPCSVIGGHVGHNMMSLEEASEKKKKKLRNLQQKLMAETEKAEERVQSLEENRRKMREKANGETERVTALFRDLRRRLEDLEKRVLSEITRRAQLYGDIFVQLEVKKEELSRKMRDIEELCNMTDPLTVLQESDTCDLCDTEDGDEEEKEENDLEEEEYDEEEDETADPGDLCDMEEGDHKGRETNDEKLYNGQDLNMTDISHMLHTLYDFMSGVHICFYAQEAADILLDINTAGNYLRISDDRKTASWSEKNQYRPETREQFQHPHVISSQSFSSGRRYWDVDVGGSDRWRVGMCYPSVIRRGWQSVIGDNNKSWCLYRRGNQYSVMHDTKVIHLPDQIPSDKVRIDLDYEARQISFYALCDPIRHLHTFTATFTETLHAALYVGKGCIKISGRNREL